MIKRTSVIDKKTTGNMVIEDLEGNQHILQATTIKDDELNGDESIEGLIEYTEVNTPFIENVAEMWSVYDTQGKGHKIILLDKKGKGNKMTVEFTAIPLFFHYFDKHSMMETDKMHKRYDGSATAYNTFNMIFKDTPYTFVLIDSFNAIEWTNLGGGENLTKSFERAIKRLGAEFEIHGKEIHIKKQAGRDTSIQYRHRLNANNIVEGRDATGLYTNIIGYGDYGDSQAENDEDGEEDQEDYRDARLIRSYESPLWKVYGERLYAPPHKDGRMSITKNMDKALKDIVDNSLIVTISADVINLRDQGYPIDISQVGDRVFIIDERISFKEEVRIVSQSIKRNWKNEVIDAKINFGGESLGKKYQGKINSAIDTVTDIIEGNNKIDNTFLDDRIISVTDKINGNKNSNFEYMSTGVKGWNKDNPNYMTKYVGDGIGFSTDGGYSYIQAISAELGINASSIMAGELRGINIIQESAEGSLSMTGGEVESYRFGSLAMKWGGWEQAFYNPDGSLIGTLEPTRILDRDFYGLSLTVTNDFLTIGHWVDGQRRPVFRTQEFEGNKSTYVLGPYDDRGQENHTELVLGANSNVGLSEDGKFDRYRQATILLKDKPEQAQGNSIGAYFGGVGGYEDQEFEIRANINETTSRQVAVFRRNESRFNNKKTYFGSRSGHINDDDDGLTIFASESGSGLKLWHGGQVDVMSKGVAVHKFLSDGRKVGGSIDIEGVKHGMSPVDSPQVLIEYVEFNVTINEATKTIYLDEKYRKAVSNYTVFSSNSDVKIIEKNNDHFIISGKGTTDLRIIGERVGSEGKYWFEMN